MNGVKPNDMSAKPNGVKPNDVSTIAKKRRRRVVPIRRISQLRQC